MIGASVKVYVVESRSGNRTVKRVLNVDNPVACFAQKDVLLDVGCLIFPLS